MLGIIRLEEDDSEELLWRGAGMVTSEATLWFWMLYQYKYAPRWLEEKSNTATKSPLCTDVQLRSQFFFELNETTK